MKKYYLPLVIFIMFSCKKNEENNLTKVNHHGVKPGKYRFYNKSGTLDKELEYIDLCGKVYLNQGWYFTKNLDTFHDKGNYYKIFVEKNILKPKESSRIILKYKPLMKNSISVLLLGNKNIDDDFCNLKQMKFDTLYFVNNSLAFTQSFKNKGNKNIGGYIFEIKKLNKKNNNNNIYDERKVYFKIPFVVK